MNTASPSLIVIGGYMHSGTTLLHEIVSSHNSVYKTYKETKLFEWRNSIQERYNQTNNKLEYLQKIGKVSGHNETIETFEFCGDVVIDYLNFISTNASLEGKDLIIEGSPNNYLFLDRIPKGYAHRIKILLLTRDPRDILSSVKKRVENVKRKNYSNHFEFLIDKSNYHYSQFLNTLSIRKSFKKMYEVKENRPSSTMLIDYKDLTLNYELTLKKVADFLDISQNGFPKKDNLKTSNSATMKIKNGGLYYSSNYNSILNHTEISYVENRFKFYFSTKPNMKTSGSKLLAFWGVFYFNAKAPFDLIFLILKRFVRFRSSPRFFHYIKTSYRRIFN